MADYAELPGGDGFDNPEDWCPICEGYHPEDVPCAGHESDPDPDDPIWDERWALTEAPEMAWYRLLLYLAGDDGGHQ